MKDRLSMSYAVALLKIVNFCEILGRKKRSNFLSLVGTLSHYTIQS